MTKDIRENNGSGYIDDKGKKCMIRCFDCGRENYAMCVATGFCTWCGYNANEKPKKRKKK